MILCGILSVFCLLTLSKTNGTDNRQKKSYVDFFKRYTKFHTPRIDSGKLATNEYDFIVIGAGTTGSVIASRLSENPNWRVLLLETGGEPSIFTDIPAVAAQFQFTNYNWGYLMEEQENFGLGLIDRRMHWPRGKVLGGSSTINYMMHIRGNKHDYDRWAAEGNPGWSYKDVLPFFLKSEDSRVRIEDPGYHNKGGYLSVEDVDYRTVSGQAFIKAAQEVGYPYRDYNGEKQLGVSFIQATLRNGHRCSAEKAFLQPARKRKNLTILTYSRVSKILIEPTTKTVYGVEFIQQNKYHTARASKEVILSAGVFNSPQLLMLSGIGPKDHLEELGIHVLKHLPGVGQNLRDHITFLGLFFAVNQSIVSQQSILEQPSSIINFLLNGTGPLASLGGVEAVAFFKSSVAEYQEDYPDIELIFIGGGIQTDQGKYYRRAFRITEEIYEKVWKAFEKKFAWSVFPVLFHPKSRGYLKLKSKNPFHWPKLYGNFLTDEKNQDVRALIAGIREVQRIAAAPAFQRYGTELVKTPIPGCEGEVFDSDQYWECAIRHVTSTIYHPIGACKMGPTTDPEAVVDNKLRVYGITNLRVADTSIIPLTLSAHTNVPAFMVGEKAADMIKEHWGYPDPIDRK